MIELVEVIDEHGSEVEYDLIRCGLRLRDFPDRGVSWGDLKAVISQCQLRPDSALWRAIHPDEWQWSALETQLLATLVDETRVVQYILRAANGDKTAKPPKPIPRPGVEDGTTYGGKGGALPIEEMVEWLGGGFDALIN